MSAPVGIRLATAADAPAFARIVNHYIATTAINFRTSPQGPDEWAEAMAKAGGRHPWLAATDGDVVVGLAYASTWNARSAYDWSVETTVYVAADAPRRGIGRALYARLFDLLDAQGFRAALALIALPNAASVGLHEAFGFAPAGTLRSVGHKLGAWRDVGIWQRLAPSHEAPPARLKSVAEVA